MLDANILTRLVFGFKIRHLRLKKKISYQVLSKETGLSVSYLNDIEKGKKFPKPDKIRSLAAALDSTYELLIGSASDKSVQPILELLSSDFLRYFPLDSFGISLEKLVDVFSNAPQRFSAFISTVLKIIRSYRIEQEDFYRIALRSYQDLHNNYFPELEARAEELRELLQLNQQPTIAHLTTALTEVQGVQLNREKLAEEPKLSKLRSYYANNVLYLNASLLPAQERFALAREISFQHLKPAERPQETYLNRDVSFEKLLSNFQASYIAAALLLPAAVLEADLKKLAWEQRWSPALIGNWLQSYQVSPETLLQRLTNLLPAVFGVDNLFFIRLERIPASGKYIISKELHLSQLHQPYQNRTQEHLCHRWVSIGVMQQAQAQPGTVQIDAQISNYWQSDKSYFCLSVGEAVGGKVYSVTLGLLLNDRLKASFNFLKDPSLRQRTVNTTCEACSVPDCESRVAPPVRIEQARHEQEVAELLINLDERDSSR